MPRLTRPKAGVQVVEHGGDRLAPVQLLGRFRGSRVPEHDEPGAGGEQRPLAVSVAPVRAVGSGCQAGPAGRGAVRDVRRVRDAVPFSSSGAASGVGAVSCVNSAISPASSRAGNTGIRSVTALRCLPASAGSSLKADRRRRARRMWSAISQVQSSPSARRSHIADTAASRRLFIIEVTEAKVRRRVV